MSCIMGYVMAMLQTYLTEGEFKQVFGVTLEEFEGMPKWRQNDLKQRMGLF